jgi:putative cardiolipin synthase
MGIELFEFRAKPEYHSIYTTPSVNVKRFSLHAKSIIYDDDCVYVGTLNLDPRSAVLNTEIGLLVKSNALTKSVRRAFFEDLSEGEYWKVSLNNKGKITWENGNTKTSIQPARNPVQRIFNLIYSLLPIHQQL